MNFSTFERSIDLSLVFGKNNTTNKIIGYVDSDYVGDLDKRRSLKGYVFTLSGCAIS